LKGKTQELVTGKWYLVANCEYCHTRHVVEPETSQDAVASKEIYKSECPGCRRIGFYTAAKVERYLHGERKLKIVS
jgi:hypothetical protein